MNPINYDGYLKEFKDPILLKKGGQKAVFKAIHKELGTVVVKIGQYDNPSSLERIQREVQLLRNISSEYYPKNYDFDVVDDGIFLIVEEFLEARPLSELMDQYPELDRILILIREIVLALRILWDNRIVHRDVKPDNILITENGQPKIIDLGIARVLNAESLTRTVALRGPCTPIYAAPEQLANRKTQIDHRTDQFIIGIIMTQLALRGRHPFDPTLVGSGGSIVENILAGRYYKAAFEQPELSRIAPLASRMLGLEPFQRFRKFETLLDAIEQCLGGRGD